MIWSIALSVVVVIVLVLLFVKRKQSTTDEEHTSVTKVDVVEDDLQQFLQRIPVFNNSQKVIGYQITLTDEESTASFDVLLGALSKQDLSQLCSGKKLYVCVPITAILAETVTVLPSSDTVLILSLKDKANNDLVEACKTLKQQGYQIALQVEDETAFQHPLYQLADYLIIDYKTGAILDQLVTHARGESKRIFISGIEHQSQFDQCKFLGVNGYQGYFFSEPEVLDNVQLGPQVESAMNLFNLVMSQAPQDEIEQAFKTDTVLAFTLLKYINSAGFGLRNEVSSIKAALVFLGYEKLARWLGVLMASTNNVEHGAQEALFELATKRARLMELLGEKHFSESERDGLFITGMFSVLDAMLGMPMEKALANLNLPEPAMDALLQHKGSFYDVLCLAIACEQSALEKILPLSKQFDLRLNEINQKHLAAIEWANAVRNV